MQFGARTRIRHTLLEYASFERGSSHTLYMHIRHFCGYEVYVLHDYYTRDYYTCSLYVTFSPSNVEKYDRRLV